MLRPVHPAANAAATKANGLRMGADWPPDQLQFQPGTQGRQTAQPSANDSLRGLSAVNAGGVGRLPVRPVGVFPTIPTLNDCFHDSLLLTCRLRPWVGH
jgi:hypothetical protein